MGKYYVTATITAKPEHADALRRAMLDNIPHVRAEDGCERYHLLVNRENPAVFLMDEIWRDETALEKHSHAPHMRAYKEKTAHMLLCPTTVSVWQGVDAE